MVMVRETDPAHGGLPITSLYEQCPADLRERVFSAQLLTGGRWQLATKHVLDAASRDAEVDPVGNAEADPVGKDRPMVDFYRLKDFQLVTLRQIGQQLMTSLIETRADDTLYIAGELVERPLMLPSRLVASEHNAGASDLLLELQGQAETSSNRPLSRALSRSLTRSLTPARSASDCFLLLLDERTFESSAVEAEVHAALDTGQRRVLVHDARVAFSDIIARTPPLLKERRLYDDLAVMLLTGEHRQVSLRYIAAKMTPSRSVLATAASSVGAEIGTRGKTLRSAALRALPNITRRAQPLLSDNPPALELGSKSGAVEQTAA